MRSIQRNDGRNPIATQSKPFPKTNLQRRGFLMTLGVGGAGAAAVTMHSLSRSAIQSDANREPDADASGYRETEHVRRYYRTAKL